MKIDQKKVTAPETLALLVGWGAFLRGCRIEQRKTHQEVAQVCALSRQTVSRIEKGDPSVSVGQVMRYAHALGQAEQLKAPEAPVQATQRVRKRWSDLLAGTAVSKPIPLTAAPPLTPSKPLKSQALPPSGALHQEEPSCS